MSESKIPLLLKHSFVRFLLVGVLNTIIGLSVSFILFNAIGVDYWIATFGGNTVGAVVSYFLNRRFTFRSSVSIGSSWWKFAAVILICYFVSYGASLWIADFVFLLVPQASLSLEHNAAILIGNGLYTILNYLGQKFFAFRPAPGKSA